MKLRKLVSPIPPNFARVIFPLAGAVTTAFFCMPSPSGEPSKRTVHWTWIGWPATMAAQVKVRVLKFSLETPVAFTQFPRGLATVPVAMRTLGEVLGTIRLSRLPLLGAMTENFGS